MNLSDLNRNSYMLRGSLARRGYMRWWHSFSGTNITSGETRTFFMEFFIINPALGQSRPILGQRASHKKKGIKPSYVMINVGTLPDENGYGGKQLHAFYPITALRTTPSPLIMQVGDCIYKEDSLSGFVEVSNEEASRRALMTDAGYMEWDLRVHKAVSCHTGFFGSRIAQMLNALESYWHGEGIRSFFEGSVVLDGEVYEVTAEQSYGYADKHWGRNFNSPWLQLACSRLTSHRTGQELRHSALAVNGCAPRFFFLPLKHRLMLQLTYTGEDFAFTRCKWEVKETDKRFVWRILAHNKNAVLKISGSCTRAQLMRMRYENPDGQRTKLPLLAGVGTGTAKLYRKTPDGKELLDTLNLDNLFCEYRAL